MCFGDDVTYRLRIANPQTGKLRYYCCSSIQVNRTKKPESRADLYSLLCTSLSLKIGDPNENRKKYWVLKIIFLATQIMTP